VRVEQLDEADEADDVEQLDMGLEDTCIGRMAVVGGERFSIFEGKVEGVDFVLLQVFGFHGLNVGESVFEVLLVRVIVFNIFSLYNNIVI